MCQSRYRQVVALRDISELPILALGEECHCSPGSGLFNRFRRPAKDSGITRLFIIHNNGLQYGTDMTLVYTGYLPINSGANISIKLSMGYPHSGAPYPNSSLHIEIDLLSDGISAPITFGRGYGMCEPSCISSLSCGAITLPVMSRLTGTTNTVCR